MALMRFQSQRSKLPKNAVAADVSPLTLSPEEGLEPTHVGCYGSWLTI